MSDVEIVERHVTVEGKRMQECPECCTLYELNAVRCPQCEYNASCMCCILYGTKHKEEDEPCSIIW